MVEDIVTHYSDASHQISQHEGSSQGLMPTAVQYGSFADTCVNVVVANNARLGRVVRCYVQARSGYRLSRSEVLPKFDATIRARQM